MKRGRSSRRHAFDVAEMWWDGTYTVIDYGPDRCRIHALGRALLDGAGPEAWRACDDSCRHERGAE